jgi:hypothetical protein
MFLVESIVLVVYMLIAVYIKTGLYSLVIVSVLLLSQTDMCVLDIRRRKHLIT